VTRIEFAFTDADRQIVAELRRNGRATNQQIADNLGLTATTVSARIKRMEEADQLRVVAVSDFSAHGYDVLIQLAIEVDNRPASVVARELAEFDEVFAIHLVTGRYDIDALVVLREFADLSHFLLDRLASIRGIRSITPSIAVDILRYQFDVAPIEARI
jgi:Lrp/AsnC family transcriptional regulator for asnA, asnC and gidA